jgi:hypothetical protein
MERRLLASDCRQKKEQAKLTASRLLVIDEEPAETTSLALDESLAFLLPLALRSLNIITLTSMKL